MAIMGRKSKIGKNLSEDRRANIFLIAEVKLFIFRFQIRDYGTPTRPMTLLYIIRLEPQVEVCLYSGKSEVIGSKPGTLESSFPEKTKDA
jgi:hypothetical protein